MTVANKTLQVASGGLTTATTAYSAGDQVGTIFTFANFGTSSGLGGLLGAAELYDETKIIGAYSLFVFSATVSLAADNAAFAISDPDAQLLLPGFPVQLGAIYDLANNREGSWQGSVPYNCGATSLFAALRADVGHTFFGATTSLKLSLAALTLP